MIRNRIMMLVIVTACLLNFGCAGMSQTEQRTLSGAAIGAAGGAALTAISGGNPAIGAGVGGAVGGLTGYILGEHHK